MIENTASTSPLGKRSGAFSKCQRIIRANPCWGPKDQCPNWATKKKKRVITLESHKITNALTEDKWNPTTDWLLSIENSLLTANIFFNYT